MNGAREYANLFTTGQYGRLYITSGGHARGKTFRIQVLPKDEKAKFNGNNNMCTNKDAIEVYGIISGQPGWTESYGWLHGGNWQNDFFELVEKRKLYIACIKKKKAETLSNKVEIEKTRVANLLSDY